MWPFNKRLRDQNALEKHSRWLKRWFMGGNSNRVKTGVARITLS